MPTMRSAGHYWASILAEELVMAGIQHICLAPGSRSTPIVKAFHNHDKLQISTHYDERSLAFFALGQAKKLESPVVVVTTSGTAVANLMPAAAEALNMKVPLVFLTADRPDSLLHCGANQTMNQKGLLKNVVLGSLNLPTASEQLDTAALRLAIQKALHVSNEGPVHMNMPIDEPLLAESLTIDESTQAALTLELSLSKAGHETALQAVDAKRLIDMLSAKKVLCLLAISARDYHSDALIQALKKAGIPLVAECTSRLPFEQAVSRQFDSYCDAIEKPELLLCIGAKWLTRQTQHFISQCDEVVLLHDFDESQDFLKAATCEMTGDINTVIKALEHVEADSSYKPVLKAPLSNGNQQASIEEQVLQGISASKHQFEQVFLGNSLPIRLFNAAFNPKQSKTSIYCNRGVSGIDGIVSSAAGLAYLSQSPSLLINGDMSSLHDSNGFYFLQKYKLPLTVLIFNNNGGGIFSKLAVKQETDIFEDYFKMPHGLKFQHLAAHYHLDYVASDDPAVIIKEIEKNKEKKEAKIIECFC